MGFKTITNGIQHIATRNNTKDRADGGKQSYKNREAMRIRVKELIWNMLQKKEFPKGTRKKIIIQKISAILKKTDPELAREFIKTLNLTNDITDLDVSISNWYTQVLKNYNKK